MQHEHGPLERKITGGRWLPGVSWALYEAGRVPFLALITGAVFLPYFATTVIGDPVHGQSEVARFGTIAGVVAALTAPVLGASIDRLGRRKPWIAAGTGIMVALLAALWWTLPGGSGLPIWAVIAMLVAIKVIYNYTEVLHNSLIVRNAEGVGVSKLSALSLALGCVSALAVLVTVLWAFVLPEKTHHAFIPDRPLLGLDPAHYEHLRISAPLCAALMALMAMPLLLFAKDHAATGESVATAFTQAARYIFRLPSHLRQHGNATLFLLSRMLYADGTAALALFGGVYAAGVMGWGATELLTLGIIRLVFAIPGAFVASMVDGWLGPKRSVQLSLSALIVAVVAMVGTDQHTTVFLWAHDPKEAALWTGPLFTSAPEMAFLLINIAIAVFSVAVSSSSRALLTEITPPQETGAFFGLYALASTATAWLAPLLIDVATHVSGTQQGGFAPVIGLFIIGFVGLGFVHISGTSREGDGHG